MGTNLLAIVMAALFLGAVVPQSAAQTFSPNLKFNISTDTMSGIFNWGVPESAARNTNAGYIPWQVEYTNATMIEPGMIGSGYPSHVSSSQYYAPDHLPNMTFGFPGTGWWMTGLWDPWNASSSYNDISIDLDNSQYQLQTQGLVRPQFGWVNDLSWTYHTVSYNVRTDYVGGGNLTVGQLWMTTGMLTEAPTFEHVNRSTSYFVQDGHLNPDFLWQGQWDVTTQLGGAGSQPVIDYVQAVGDGNRSTSGQALVTIPVPANTSFVILNGTMGPDYDEWAIEWSPVPSLGQSPQYINPYSKWYAPGVMMTFMPLHPATLYNISIYTQNGGKAGVSSMTFFSGLYDEVLTPTIKSHNRKVGIIVGATIGGIVGALVLTGVVLWLLRRRRLAASQRANSASYIEDKKEAIEMFEYAYPQQLMWQGYTDGQLQSSLPEGVAALTAQRPSVPSIATSYHRPSNASTGAQVSPSTRLSPYTATAPFPPAHLERVRSGSVESQELIYYGANGSASKVTITPMWGPGQGQAVSTTPSEKGSPRTSFIANNSPTKGSTSPKGSLSGAIDPGYIPPLVDDVKLALLRSPNIESPRSGSWVSLPGRPGATSPGVSPTTLPATELAVPQQAYFGEQESDAGALVPYNTVPPMYDPAWALEHGTVLL